MTFLRAVVPALLLLCPSPGLAQTASATLTGLVRDASGAAVPGATVTVVALATGGSRRVVTTDAGLYAVAGLAPGVCRVTVTLDGFRAAVYERVELRIGEPVRLDGELMPGSVAEAISVTAAAPILRDVSAALGRVVEHGRIVELPLNGRSFIALASLAPGVALPPGSLLPRINGGRPRTNEYLFDGISVLQPEPGQVAFFPVVDAIQEFRIHTNSPPAEFGRFNGGVVNLTTRGGTNALHGTAFGFVRHEALNARHLFAPADAAGPRFRRQQIGGVAGGPLARDRAFFFADYQGQRQQIARTAISTVPTALQRQGIFTEPIGGRVPIIYDPATGTSARAPFPGNAIPAARIDPIARALLERYPAPTSAGTANNFRRTAGERDDQDQFDLRLDYRPASGRGQAFARLSYLDARFRPVTPLPDGSGVTSGTLGPQDSHAWAFASSYQHTFSSRWLNELRLGDTRRAVTRRAARLADGRLLPTYQIAGYQQLGSPASTESMFSTSVTQVADALTWVAGRHTLKMGFDARWPRLNVVQPPSPAGLYQFTALFSDLPGTPNTGAPLASFLLGQVQTFSLDVQHDEIRNRAHTQEYYVQDDWRVSDRLTIAPGLRYTLNFPSTETRDQAAVFNLATRELEYLGRDGHPRAARRLHTHNVGPRLGIVGRLTGRDVVSSGYALVWIEQAGITTPFTAPVFPFLQTVGQRTLDGLTPAFVLADGPAVAPLALTPQAGLGQGVFAVDRDLGSGYVQQWNASYQRQLGSRLAAEVAYVGSTITRVGVPDTNLNQLSADQLALGDALLQRVPNPYFGIIPRASSLGDPTLPLAQLLKPYPEHTTVSLYRNNVGTTHYHGVTARLEQRLTRGVSYSASYTRSRLMDDASAVFDASVLTGPVANYPVADSFNRRRERDYSTGDIPHVFVASFAWELLRGWNVAGIATWQSGTPVAVTQATNFNAFAGFGTQRPNLVGRPELSPDQRSTARWFDTGAFAVAPPFTLGTSSRNPVRGPGYRNLDVVVTRRIALGGTRVLELRAETFNVLNTPPLGNPNGVLGTAGFGSITTAGDPRVMQLAAKVSF